MRRVLPLKGPIRPLPLLLASLWLASAGMASGADTDGDLVDDISDNCVLDANPTQYDADHDGFGNACDADLSQDGVVNFVDLALMKSKFFTSDAIADLNGDGVVNFGDLAVMKKSFFKAPGPAGPNPGGGSLFKGPLDAQSYSGKCLTYGDRQVVSGGTPPLTDGAPVYLATCARSAVDNGLPSKLQHLVVEEITALSKSRYSVILHAGDHVVGVASNALIAQAPLELQSLVKGAPTSGQIFTLDGDSIILAADRNLVVELANARGADGTRLVLGQRDLDDPEFWTFVTPAGNPAPPTSGFVRVTNAGELTTALANGRRGTVVQVDADRIDLSDHLDYGNSVKIPFGVTLRGDRRGMRFGPELFADFTATSQITGSMLEIFGNDVRITGLRLRGPTRDVDAKPGYFDGVVLNYEDFTAIVDHNDISDWTVGGVNLHGIYDTRECQRDANGQFLYRIDPATRQLKLRVLRNFIHHNRNYNGKGYGVSVGNGSYASIDGNVFLDNRHSIAGDGTTYAGYSAWFNIVLSHATQIDNGNYQQDFDMHGSNGGYGPPGGTGVGVIRNTFLGTNRNNLYLRGEPCSDPDEFSNNILRQTNPWDVVEWWLNGDESHEYPDPFPAWIVGEGNQFGAANPTSHLAVGDFDGDKVDDLFLATGAAWYFAPDANAEWRLINAKTEGVEGLLFGDFDGDARTDVLKRTDGVWLVAWGGASQQWEYLNSAPAPVADTAIGDFDGDGRSDLFYTDGDQWYVSRSGSNPFVSYATSSYRVKDLRFGDFDGDHKTDVFGVVSGQWMAVYGGTATWAPLRAALTSNVDGLVVADFNGNGLADVATSLPIGNKFVWAISKEGKGAFEALRISDVALHQAVAVGRFDNAPGADVLLWHDDYLDLSASGSATPVRQSRQDMR